MAIDIGRIAYERYCSCLPYGYLQPAWELIGSSQNAWREAAVAVIQYLDKSKDDSTLDVCE